MKDTQLESNLLENNQAQACDPNSGEALLQEILKSFESFDRALGNTVHELFPWEEIK
ncbi:hypothetical protein [Leptospira tipperaryensis]|uniref:hypothetical protein n=1 Tax=Leptospira tipperaryensis TaxID=2564040 RepID=UPI00156BB478|nr:hypothetical protein [Leptospira tipperaryensis]